MNSLLSNLLVCSLVLMGAAPAIQAQCPSGYSQIIVEIITDSYPNETSWDIKDGANTIIASGTTNNDTLCYATGSLLQFTIYDSYGDGICCGYGDGSYNVYLNGVLVISGGQFGFSQTTSFNYPPGEISGLLMNDMQQLLDHCTSAALLSATQLNALAAHIDEFHLFLADDLSVITAAFSLIDCYESTTGPMFLNAATTGGFPNAPGALDGFEYHRAVFLVQQELFKMLYTKPKVAQYSSFLNGRKYLTSNFFPGACTLPVDPTQTFTATVNATMQADWGRPTAWSTSPVRRPTGYYLSPGSIATVQVPSAMVNAGYKILVGAHPLMSTTVHSTVKRFFGVASTYAITDPVTLIANPFGGGIYIVTPYLGSAGLQQIQLTNVVPAPYFSTTSANTTSLSEWQNVQRQHPGPWADFETDKFMMQVPTNFIYNYNDPVTLMADWDARMDVVSDLLGYPMVRSKQVLYIMPDVQIMHGAYGIGDPQINNIYNPNDIQNGNSQQWYLVPGVGGLSDTEFHELGHAQSMLKFPGEPEAIVNVLAATVYNELYGSDIDIAFGRSFDGQYWLGRDQAATNWMVTHNFRVGNPMDISNTTLDEVRYQHRGYGKYVEIAALFGWEALHDHNLQENLDYINGVPPGPLGEVDDRILGLSQAAGFDLRPLIHFWGVHPENPAALAQAITSENLPPSALICERLQHYQSIIPLNNAQFNAHAQDFFNGPVPPGGDPDYGSGWYNIWLPLYNDQHGDSAVAAMQDIIELYYPNGCLTVDVPHTNNEAYLSVFPNPNNGHFTISFSGGAGEITITDLLGQEVLRTQLTHNIANLQIETNGAYLLQVKTDSTTMTRKLIINR